MERTSGRPRPAPRGCARSATVVMVTMMILHVLPVVPLPADNIGREFFFSFPPNFQQGGQGGQGGSVQLGNLGSTGIVLTAATLNLTTIDLKVPLKGYGTRMILDPLGPPLHIDMPHDVASNGISGITNGTVWIASNRDVSVTAFNLKDYTMDMFSVLPAKHLGKEYYIATYAKPGEAVIQISALAVPTAVEVHLNEAVTFLGISYSADDVIRHTLNRFETIQLETKEINIVGTRIIANVSIAVTVGCSCAYVPPQFHRCDHIAEQLIPFNRWGQSYVISPLANRLAGYMFQIVAGRDNTIVTINDVTIKLDSREFYAADITTQRMIAIKASKPVMIMQYSKGTFTDSRAGDPAMTIIAPIESYSSRVSFSTYDFTAAGITDMYLSVTAECNATNGIYFDGTPYYRIRWGEAYNVTTQDNRQFCTRWMAVEGGKHILSGESSSGRSGGSPIGESVFTSLVYGVGTRIAYLLNPGFSLEKVTCVDSDPATPGREVEVQCGSLQPQICALEETNSNFGLMVWEETRPVTEVWSNIRCMFDTLRAGLPVAKRTCISNSRTGAYWSPITFMDCGHRQTQLSAGELAGVDVDSSNVFAVSDILEKVTGRLNEVDDALVNSIADTLEHIIAAESPSPQVTRSVGNTVDNLISSIESTDSSSPQLAASSSRVVRSLEQQVSLTLHESGEFNLDGTNVVVKAVTFDTTTMPDGIEFSGGGSGGNTSGASIKLPASIFKMVAYNNIVSSTKQVRFIMFNSDALFRAGDGSRTSGSVISAAVEGTRVEGLGEPVVISYEHVAEGNDTASNQSKCVYWDFSLNNGVGDWSGRGCKRMNASMGMITCACNHLTNFAVLVDYSGQHTDEETALHFALDLLSKIGCIVSIIALAITILIFIAFRRLRSSRPRRILVHFCISLLCLYLVFLFGLDHAAGYDLHCIIVGALLHYFLLTTMAWMSVEALNMYLMIVRVFDEEGRHFLLKASVLAWGSPMVVVGLTAGFRTEDYLNKQYCFLTPGLIFFLAVLLPIALVLSFNFIIFIVVVRRLWTANLGGNVPLENEDKAVHRYNQLRARLLNAFSISVLLGLTWVFGFLAIEGATFIFQLIFCIANAFQGVVVFILFCVRQEDVRKSLKPHYSRLTSLLPQAARPSTVTAYSLTSRSPNNTAERGDAAVTRCPLRTSPVPAPTYSSKMSSDVVRLTSNSGGDEHDDMRYRMASDSDGDYDYRMTSASDGMGDVREL